MSTDPLIAWSDPPSGRQALRKSRFDPIINALRERPGEWACIQRNPEMRRARNAAEALKYRAQKLGISVEVTCRRTRDRDDYGVWAKYAPQDAS